MSKTHKIIIGIALAMVIGMVVSVVFLHSSKRSGPAGEASISSFAECARQYPVRESYPEVCVVPGGQEFVNPEQQLQP